MCLPGDRSLGKIVAIEFAHSESDISLSKTKLDPSLFERFGELF